MRARRQPAVGVVAVGVGLRRAADVLPRRPADVAAVLRRGACLVGVRDGELVRPQRRSDPIRKNRLNHLCTVDYWQSVRRVYCRYASAASKITQFLLIVGCITS